MRRRRAWEPNTEELRVLTEHLFYEVQMTFFLAGQLGAPVDLSLRNAQIEAFAVHLRQLIDFFWGERPRSETDRVAFAADYFPGGEWARIRPEKPAIVGKGLTGWTITRLTYDRELVRPIDREWDLVTQAFALAQVVVRFVDTVNPAQFAPGFLHGMRVCAEMFGSSAVVGRRVA